MKNMNIVDETLTWYKVQNMMTTSQADAPYLGAIQAKGTVDFSDFVKGVKADGCSESELEIRRVMTKHEELMKGYVAQNYKVYSPVGIAGVHLTKSFPAQDAPFDPSVNEAIMSIQTNAETRNALAGVKLKEDKAMAATLKGPKINSVCTDGTRFGVIVCYQPFTVAGSGLRLDPSKATDKLTLTSDKTGAVTDVTSYTCDGEGFRIDAQVNASLTPGKYVLTAYVDMGDAEHPNVLTAPLKVTVEAGEAPDPLAPKVTRVESEGVDEGEYNLMEPATFEGENLGLDGLVEVKYTATRDGEVVAEHAFGPDDSFFDAETSTPTALKTAGGVGPYIAGAEEGDLLRVDITNAHGTASVELTLKSV